jgi:hypothetical protein
MNVHVCVVQSTEFMRLKKNIHGTKAIENKTIVDGNFSFYYKDLKNHLLQ